MVVDVLDADIAFDKVLHCELLACFIRRRLTACQDIL